MQQRKTHQKKFTVKWEMQFGKWDQIDIKLHPTYKRQILFQWVFNVIFSGNDIELLVSRTHRNVQFKLNWTELYTTFTYRWFLGYVFWHCKWQGWRRFEALKICVEVVSCQYFTFWWSHHHWRVFFGGSHFLVFQFCGMNFNVNLKECVVDISLCYTLFIHYCCKWDNSSHHSQHQLY